MVAVSASEVALESGLEAEWGSELVELEPAMGRVKVPGSATVTATEMVPAREREAVLARPAVPAAPPHPDRR
jgi:hypothetical protein